MIVRSSPQLIKQVTKVLDNSPACLFKLECTFINAESNLILTTDFVDSFNIIQDFTRTYLDLMSISVKFTVSEYKSILNGYQNLKCKIKLSRYDKERYTLADAPPIEVDAIAILNNHADLLKKFADGQLEANEYNLENDHYLSQRIPVDFQLFEEQAYNLRHVKMNSILRNATAMDVFQYAMQAAGITNSSIIPPDNTSPEPEFIIPPLMGMDGLFDFIQSRYGAYSKGLDYYFTEGILYIYPSFDSEPKSSPVVGHVYNIPENNWIGNDAYHALLDGDLHIISNTATDLTESSERGIENVGNTVIINNSDGSVDARSETNDNRCKLKPTLQTIETTSGNKGVKPEANNVTYMSGTKNIYAQASKMAAFDGGNLTIGWLNAEPFLITPGMKMIYHYDDKESYKVHSGMAKGCSYSFTQVEKPSYKLFGCNAIVNIQLNPIDKSGQ